jgi:branched-chain amino acid transport system ATP-binding protein
MLEVRALTCRYGRIPALSGIDLNIDAGELVAIVGANGAGKTTLLRALSGVQPAAAATLRFDGIDVGRLRPRERVRLGIVQVPEGRQVFGALSVEDNLRLGAYARGSAATLDRVWALLPVLRERRDAPAGTLSGGQQQMLALGRALMAEPKLLLLDEPSMGLAPQVVAGIYAQIGALKHGGTTILLVDQNARAALSIADRGYVLETGRVVLAGSAAELLRNAQVQQAYLGI